MNLRKFFIITFSIMYILTLDSAFIFAQIEDTRPPELISLDFNPKIIDVTQGPATIRVTVTTQDDISGIDQGFIAFAHTTIGTQRGGTLGVSSPNSLSAEIFIPQFSPVGIYRIIIMGLFDKAGNHTEFTGNQLQSLGFPVEFFNGNTPLGQNVMVGPINKVTLNFSTVTVGGQTTIASSSSGPTPPSGFKLGNPPVYYNISTTAQFNPPVQVCISYSDTQFKNEKNLKLFHFENGAWVDVITSLDTINNIICGSVNFFSEFTLLENITIDHIIDEVKSFNLDSDIEQGLLDKLVAAKSAIERNQNKTATNILKAFINQVKAQKGKKITNEQANILINDANALIKTFGSNNLFSLFKLILLDWLNKFTKAFLFIER